MIIATLGQHWPARKLEWIMAGLSSSWGLYVLFHPEIFTDPRTSELYAGLADLTPGGLIPHLFWGWTAALVGVLRAGALYINGAHVKTPFARALAAFVTMFVFSQVVFGLWATGIANTGLVVYSWLVVADMISAYAAGKDAITAEVHKRIEQGTIHDDSRISRSLARP